MSTTVTQDQTTEPTTAPIPVTEAAAEMRQTMGAVRMAFTWMGQQRKLELGQIEQAASTFAADSSAVTASKKLWNTKHTAYTALTRIKAQATSYWRGVTLPYPQAGIRLIKQADIPAFETAMQGFKTALDEATADFRRRFEEIKNDARLKLGTLYNPADYPASPEGVIFDLAWEYPAVEPPRYLMTFNPELYELEQRRIQARFEEAAVMAETAFAEKLQELVTHLLERLTPGADGQLKRFQRSTVENFTAFYEEFQRLNVRGNTDLEALVSRAASIVGGVDYQELRNSNNNALRETLTAQMAEVRTAVDALVSTAPRRRILHSEEPVEHGVA